MCELGYYVGRKDGLVSSIIDGKQCCGIIINKRLLSLHCSRSPSVECTRATGTKGSPGPSRPLPSLGTQPPSR